MFIPCPVLSSTATVTLSIPFAPMLSYAATITLSLYLSLTVTQTWHMTSYSLSYEFFSKSVIKNKGLIINISLHMCNGFPSLS